MSMNSLDGNDINPETGVVALVLLVTLDLRLDPLDGALVVYSSS